MKTFVVTNDLNSFIVSINLKNEHITIINFYKLKNDINKFVMKKIIDQTYNTVHNHLNNIDKEKLKFNQSLYTVVLI